MRHPYRDRARELRKNLTDTERFVWSQLRRKQFAGFRFRRQLPIGHYIVDFVCLEARVILELDGGQHAEQTEEDDRRDHWLRQQRFQVLRVWNHIALTEWDSVEAKLWEMLNAGGSAPRS